MNSEKWAYCPSCHERTDWVFVSDTENRGKIYRCAGCRKLQIFEYIGAKDDDQNQTTTTK